MRSSAYCLITATLAAAVATSASGQPQPAATPAPTPAPTPSEKMKTADEVKRESVQGAATTPLRDLNVMQVKIPDILLQTMTDPYARPPRGWKCSHLIAMVQPLDEVLGPDIDAIPPGEESMTDRTRETALGAAADLASGAIPFRSWVRKLTGAERHDRLVQAAILSGSVRRAYLKGLGETKGCNPPATPSHERAGSPPVEVRRMPLKPKYPSRLPDDEQQRSGESSPSGR